MADNLRSARHSVFHRNPKKTLVIFVGIVALAIDVLTARFLVALTPRGLRVRSDIYHHDLGPNRVSLFSMYGRNSYAIRTNSLGFRDRSVREVPLDSNRHRILFIGDSFVEGAGIEYEKTFVGLAEDALAQEGIEVLNAGVSSYSPAIYLAKINYLVNRLKLKIDEVVVYVDISDAEDDAEYEIDESMRVLYKKRAGSTAEGDRAKHAHGETSPRGSLASGAKKLLKENTILTWMICRSAFHLFLGEEKSVVRRPRAMWTYDDSAFEEYGREGVKNMKQNMDRLLAILKEKNIRLTVAVYPWPDQIMFDSVDSRQAKIWQQWAEGNNVALIDYFPRFIGGRDAEDVIGQYYIEDDCHWNEKGHQVIANGFLEHYRQTHQ